MLPRYPMPSLLAQLIRIVVLVIDGQNDFTDQPKLWLPDDPLLRLAGADDCKIYPALPVPGAHEDMVRAGRMLERGLRGITQLIFTLDTHHRVGIERVPFWFRPDGRAIDPRSVITAAMVRAQECLPRNPLLFERVLRYLDVLESRGKVLVVWPVHCQIGTWGHELHPSLLKASNAWEEMHVTQAIKFLKGANPNVEHYSPLQAEVPDPLDPHTMLNQDLLNLIMGDPQQGIPEADKVIVFGEASSHCLKGGVLDLVANLPPAMIKRFALVRDCMSPVPTFEKQAQEFLEQMRALEMQIITADEGAALLEANAAPMARRWSIETAPCV